MTACWVWNQRGIVSERTVWCERFHKVEEKLSDFISYHKNITQRFYSCGIKLISFSNSSISSAGWILRPCKPRVGLTETGVEGEVCLFPHRGPVIRAGIWETGPKEREEAKFSPSHFSLDSAAEQIPTGPSQLLSFHFVFRLLLVLSLFE